MDREQQTRDTLGDRLALVIMAEVTFAALVDLVTGAPPAFVTTVTFGMVLAIGLSWRAVGRAR